MGAEGTSGCVSARLSHDSPVFPSLRGGERRGSASRKRSPGPARRRGGSHRAKARGARVSPARWGLATLSALPDRPPLPLQAGKVRGARSAPSAPSRPLRQLREPGARAELTLPSRAERRSCPKSRRRSAPPLGSCCSGARCRVSGGAAARAARTWAPAPGPRQARGGAAAWAGPRHLGASPARRRPAHLFPALRKVQTEIYPRKEGGKKPRNF